MSTEHEITIDLSQVPAAGNVQKIMRCRPMDSMDIDSAAKKLGMRQSDFMRVTIVQAARKVLADGKD